MIYRTEGDAITAREVALYPFIPGTVNLSGGSFASDYYTRITETVEWVKKYNPAAAGIGPGISSLFEVDSVCDLRELKELLLAPIKKEANPLESKYYMKKFSIAASIPAMLTKDFLAAQNIVTLPEAGFPGNEDKLYSAVKEEIYMALSRRTGPYLLFPTQDLLNRWLVCCNTCPELQPEQLVQGYASRSEGGD